MVIIIVLSPCFTHDNFIRHRLLVTLCSVRRLTEFVKINKNNVYITERNNQILMTQAKNTIDCCCFFALCQTHGIGVRSSIKLVVDVGVSSFRLPLFISFQCYSIRIIFYSLQQGWTLRITTWLVINIRVQGN